MKRVRGVQFEAAAAQNARQITRIKWLRRLLDKNGANDAASVK